MRNADSINFMANLTGPHTLWDGFDSFIGLPKTDMGSKTNKRWAWKEGKFSRDGVLPAVLHGRSPSSDSRTKIESSVSRVTRGR